MSYSVLKSEYAEAINGKMWNIRVYNTAEKFCIPFWEVLADCGGAPVQVMAGRKNRPTPSEIRKRIGRNY